MITDSFQTARENMAYDESLLANLEPSQRLYRVYKWQHPGITYSYKQPLPAALMSFDSAKRFTGGGIVFHCPGDIVLTAIGWLDDPLFKGKLKDKVLTIQQAIKQALHTIGVEATSKQPSTTPNLDYCQTYDSPYELVINNEKHVALTLRRNRSAFMIQAIIHLTATQTAFELPEAFHPYQINQSLPIYADDLIRQVSAILHSI